MYDWLTARYAFPCPEGSTARVRLSAFRSVEELPGTSRPAVYTVRFACPCGEQHGGLATHADLDWAPVGASGSAFYNVMTGRLESAGGLVAEEAAFRIKRGEWPWSFYCVAERAPRPVFPSAFRVLRPLDRRMIVAVRCPACGETSLNLVSCEHLDVPFHSDHEIEVAERLVGEEEGDRMDELAEGLARGSIGLRSESLG